VNCLYCGQDCEDGENWQEALKREIQFFTEKIGKNKLLSFTKAKT
jgi:hypothetical protein